MPAISALQQALQQQTRAMASQVKIAALNEKNSKALEDVSAQQQWRRRRLPPVLASPAATARRVA